MVSKKWNACQRWMKDALRAPTRNAINDKVTADLASDAHLHKSRLGVLLERVAECCPSAVFREAVKATTEPAASTCNATATTTASPMCKKRSAAHSTINYLGFLGTVREVNAAVLKRRRRALDSGNRNI